MRRMNIELERYPQTVHEVERRMQKKREELKLVEPKRTRKMKVDLFKNQYQPEKR